MIPTNQLPDCNQFHQYLVVIDNIYSSSILFAHLSSLLFSSHCYFFTVIKDHASYFSSAFRISSSDCQMWTHYDIMDNILCEITGRKRIVMWPPSQVDHLYLSGSSSHVLDIDQPDLKRYPKFGKAKKTRMEAILEPGILEYIYMLCCLFRLFAMILLSLDSLIYLVLPFWYCVGEILFIPALWFHNIYAIEPCIAINIFWKHLSDDQYEKKDLYGNKVNPINRNISINTKTNNYEGGSLLTFFY